MGGGLLADGRDDAALDELGPCGAESLACVSAAGFVVNLLDLEVGERLAVRLQDEQHRAA